MKDSIVVRQLADLASKVTLEVTPQNITTLAEQTNKLYAATADLINRLEAQEAAEEETPNV